MRHEWICSESLDFAEQRTPVVPRQRGKILSGNGRNDQLQAGIIAARSRAVNEFCRHWRQRDASNPG
jgi:hypothetical protein